MVSSIACGSLFWTYFCSSDKLLQHQACAVRAGISATASAVRLRGFWRNPTMLSMVCPLNVEFDAIIFAHVSCTSSKIYALDSDGASKFFYIALMRTRNGTVKNWLEVYPRGSRVHMKPKRGWILRLASSQCSLNRYSGRSPEMFSRPAPTASFPCSLRSKPPAASSLILRL